MKPILARANVGLLAEVAWSNVLLGFDFDGTLAPIVAVRDEARMTAKTSALFARVCSLYPCAVISGRSKTDVSRRLGKANVKYIMGKHGLEPGGNLRELEQQIRMARADLEEALAACAGVDVEDKRYSLAVHYRRARGKREVRENILEAIRELRFDMRTVPGKFVFNVIPARAPNKGDALLHLREKEKADIALYVGDDVTDEDVFEIDQPGRLLSIRVGKSPESAARYFLRNQAEIDLMLASLVANRSAEVRA